MEKGPGFPDPLINMAIYLAGLVMAAFLPSDDDDGRTGKDEEGRDGDEGDGNGVAHRAIGGRGSAIEGF